MYEIVGISGTSASGKDSGAEYLANKYGYMHISTADLIRQEATRRFNTEDQYVLRQVGIEMRNAGRNALARLAVQTYSEVRGDYEGVIISSYRNPEAADYLRANRGLLVFVDAPAEARYERLEGRQRSGESRSFEEFMQFERAENNGLTDRGLDLMAVRDMSDVFVNNDSDKEQFHAKLDRVMLIHPSMLRAQIVL